LFKLVKELSEIPGPVGHEERVQAYLFEYFKKFTDEVKITNIGNLIAHFPGKGKKILINAHADEIGYVVQSITDDGFLKVTPHDPSSQQRGRITYPYCTVGQKALVLGFKQPLRGVFATTTGHVLKTVEREKELSFWDIFVDVGVSSKDEILESGITVGSPVIWNPVTERFGKLISGKAMDDRALLAVMLKLCERLVGADLAYDVYMASTVQEEIGFVGASALAFEGDFDIALSLDVGLAGDIPSIEKDRMQIKLGEGPVLVHKDGAIHYDYRVLRELVEVAEKNNIAVQHGVFLYYSSDCKSLVTSNAKPCLVAPPTRYTHSPFETVHEDDLTDIVDLVYHFVTK
jgi:endoglucanase